MRRARAAPAQFAGTSPRDRRAWTLSHPGRGSHRPRPGGVGPERIGADCDLGRRHDFLDRRRRLGGVMSEGVASETDFRQEPAAPTRPQRRSYSVSTSSISPARGASVRRAGKAAVHRELAAGAQRRGVAPPVMRGSAWVGSNVVPPSCTISGTISTSIVVVAFWAAKGLPPTMLSV